MGEAYRLVRIQEKQSFFKRHSKGATFTGALIVFLTFIVNDSILENYKSLADKVDRARDSLLIRRDIRANVEQITKQYSSSAQGEMSPSYIKKRDSKPLFVDDESFERDHDVVELDASSVQNITDLMQKVPSDDMLKARFQTIADCVDKEAELEISVRMLATQKEFVKRGNFPKYLSDNTEQLEETVAQDRRNLAAALSEIHSRDNSLSREISQVEGLTLEEAHKEYISYEDRTKTWTNWKFVLYTLGWGLGLFGKLMGADGETGI